MKGRTKNELKQRSVLQAGTYVQTSPPPLERVAAAIANARVMRAGSPPISNVLDTMPAELRRRVFEDAAEAMKAIGFDDLLAACEAVVQAVHAPQKRAAVELCEVAIAKAKGGAA